MNQTKKNKSSNKSINNKSINNKSINNKSICNKSNNYIKLLTKTNTSSYIKYKKYISTLSTHFIKSQTILLSSLFKVKDDTKFTITYKQLSLTEPDTINKYSIPHFIDIFRYLISKNNYINDFINNFNLEEQNILKDKLSTHYSKTQCYTFLDTSPLGNKLLSVYNSIDTTIMTDLVINYPTLHFHKLLINSFTSYKILEDLELNIKNLILFSIVYEGQKMVNFVYLFTYDTLKYTKDNDSILDLGRDIVKRILFFNTFLNTTLYPDKFIIFMTDKKKEIDKELKEHIHFKTINVNTAVTNGNDIIIYREQELLKSIFHELIHFHNLDFRHVSPDILNNIISYLIKTHNIKENNDYLLYECITESLANILNNIYYSGTLQEMNINLQNEIMFSTLQITKILNICKYKKWNEFSHSSNDSQSLSKKKYKYKSISKSKQFKQDSCVFSYYILKLYIFLNLDTYFKHVLDSKMKFIQTKHSFDYLIHIFDSSRKNKLLEQIVNSMLEGLKLHKHSKKYKNIKKIDHIDHIDHIDNTLRMTCL